MDGNAEGTVASASKKAPSSLASASGRLGLGLTLALLSGYVDAVGFVHLGGFYLSFMSGNTTTLGTAIATEQTATVLLGLSVIGAFVVGAFAGTWLADGSGDHKLKAVLGAEIALFAIALAALAAGAGKAALMPVAVAMGMQNHAYQVVARADVGKSFVTGTLFSIGQALARAFRGQTEHAQWLTFLGSWIAFVSGAALGALVITRLGLPQAILAVAGALALLVLAITLRPRQVG